MFKVFAFSFEKPIKVISPLNRCLIGEALLIADHVSVRHCAHLCPWLVSDKHVPVLWFQSLSPGSGVWFGFRGATSEREWCVMWCLAVQSVAAGASQPSVTLTATLHFPVRHHTGAPCTWDRLAAVTQDCGLRHARSVSWPQSCGLQDMGSHAGTHLWQQVSIGGGCYWAGRGTAPTLPPFWGLLACLPLAAVK